MSDYTDLMESHFIWIQDSDIPVCPFEARIKELEAERASYMGTYHANRVKELEAELAEARAENARLVDRHNRESHGTASHEALAYDHQAARIKELEAALRRIAGDYGRLRDDLEAQSIARQALQLAPPTKEEA